MNEEIKEDIKNIRCKVESAINILKDGKQIVTYEKLLGIKDKMARLAVKVEKLSENNKDK